jgi:putative ABC transport system permease protein
VLLNETAARSVNWSEGVLKGSVPITQERIAQSSPYHRPDAPPPHTEGADDNEYLVDAQVIGVVRDFFFQSMHVPIEPVVFLLNEDAAEMMIVRVVGQRSQEARERLELAWEEFFPGEQMNLQFIDERVEMDFEADRRFGKLLSAFTAFAMIIAALGLFGLVTHAAEARTKELGIRKVLGASETGLVLLLTREFTTLVLIASIIAIPLGVFMMNRWLEEFAVRIEIGTGMIAFAVAVSLLLAWFSLLWQAVRAARRNPVDSLRYE